MSIRRTMGVMIARRGRDLLLAIAASAVAAAVLVPTVGVTTPPAEARAQQPAPRPAGSTRTYYIAADEVEWDYAPSGTNRIEGRPFNDDEKAYMERGAMVIGRQVKKALYREYTDDSFRTLKPRSAAWEHLGFLGPLIRAEVGDRVRVVFRNNTKISTTMHPHGFIYTKSSEGAPYNDGTTGTDKIDDAVPPGGTFTYLWDVPERAGPTEHEGSSTMWMYHSHVDEVRDWATGLVGPIIVTRRGMARADGSPRDVDRELVGGFIEVDENSSWYVEENIRTRASQPENVQVGVTAFFSIWARPKTGGLLYDKFFRETINGFSYGHTPGLRMKVGEHVRWYLMTGTNNTDLHSVHWHGNVVAANHMRTDVAALAPMGMIVADMEADNPGTWLFHCHVSYHMKLGMQAFYVVEPAAGSSRP